MGPFYGRFTKVEPIAKMRTQKLLKPSIHCLMFLFSRGMLSNILYDVLLSEVRKKKILGRTKMFNYKKAS